jgi:hydroxymethylpyrimidine/phosphomethylpyrimidine kinase
MNKNDKEVLKIYQRSPIPFIKDMWGAVPLVPPAVFMKGRHMTDHQHSLMLCVEKAISGEAPPRISVKSGHGTGKTTGLSWLILWYLFSFYDSQVACTAPTYAQMHDVLWKEVSVWLSLMPKAISVWLKSVSV